MTDSPTVATRDEELIAGLESLASNWNKTVTLLESAHQSHSTDYRVAALNAVMLRSAAARLRELGADAERLDWMEGEKAAIVGADSDGADPYIQCYAWGIYGRCETVREAIDAARHPTTTGPV